MQYLLSNASCLMRGSNGHSSTAQMPAAEFGTGGPYSSAAAQPQGGQAFGWTAPAGGLQEGDSRPAGPMPPGLPGISGYCGFSPSAGPVGGGGYPMMSTWPGGLVVPSLSAAQYSGGGRTKYLVPMRDIGEVEVHYFGMGRFAGRSGPIRLFLLGKQIKHSFKNVDLDESWPPRKKEITCAANPCGTLPYIVHRGMVLCETNAIMRYLAKKIGEYGSNQRCDYIADMVADKVAYWRDELMHAFEDFHRQSSDTIPERYLQVREEQYELFEKILAGSPTPFIATEKPSWADFALFAAIWDDHNLMEGATGASFTPDLLPRYPGLRAFHDEISRLPLIEAYREEVRQEGVESDAAESQDPPSASIDGTGSGARRGTVIPSIMSQQLWSDNSAGAMYPHMGGAVVTPQGVPMMMGSFPGMVPRAPGTSSLALGPSPFAFPMQQQHHQQQMPQQHHQQQQQAMYLQQLYNTPAQHVDPRTFGRYSDEE